MSTQPQTRRARTTGRTAPGQAGDEGPAAGTDAEATAAEVSEADRERCLAVVGRRARAEGFGGWTADDVVAPASLRLYHAVVSRLFVLHPDRDIRREVPVDLEV